jgi:hypothetical protein
MIEYNKAQIGRIATKNAKMHYILQYYIARKSE